MKRIETNGKTGRRRDRVLARMNGGWNGHTTCQSLACSKMG